MAAGLFLPISRETVEVLINENIDQGDVYNLLSVPELASLLIIKQIPDLVKGKITNREIEKGLATAIHAANEYSTLSDSPFRGLVADKINVSLIQAGIDALQNTKLGLLPETTVRSREYLTSDGEWDFMFTMNYKPSGVPKSYEVKTGKSAYSLRDQQYRLLNEIKTNYDDDIDIQGYAGTGKTFLLSIVIETFLDGGINPNQMCVLAYRPAQIKAIKARLPSEISVLSYGYMASVAIPFSDISQKINNLKKTYRARGTFNPKKYAEELGVQHTGSISDVQAANCIFYTVRNYCLSADNDINESHIPKLYTFKKAEDKAYIIQQAILMWGLTIDRPKDLPMLMPLMDYHIIKYVALNGWTLPASHSHIILDESQDLSPAFAQILNRSPNIVMNLGDRFQSISGKQGARSAMVRPRQLTDSARVPMTLDQIINKVLGDSPFEMQDEFKGNPERNTAVEYYKKAYVPDEPCAIWVHDEWEMLEWAQMVSALGRTFSLISDLNEFSNFVSQSLELYYNQIPSRLFALAKFRSWNSAWRKLSGNSAFVRVSKMYESGFKYADWEKTKSLHTVNGEYVIGRYEDARGREYDSVLLAPSIVKQLNSIQNKDTSKQSLKSSKYELSSKMYLGVTRTKSKLYAPEDLRLYIEETG